MLQLEPVLDRRPSQLAEGEKQRVAVGRCIIRDPSCFLFDEPLSRLDVQLREEMRGEIKLVLQGLQRPTIIVTHDQLEALTMADRIAVMRSGLIEQVGDAARDLRQARQPVRRRLHRHAADEPDRRPSSKASATTGGPGSRSTAASGWRSRSTRPCAA